MVALNQQLSIAYECVSAIGTSLELKRMMNTFLRTFAKKTGAIVGAFWIKSHHDYTAVCSYGKQSLVRVIKPPETLENTIGTFCVENMCVVYMKVGNGIVSFLFSVENEALQIITSILSSIHTKLDNAIHACSNHEQLILLNETLEEQVRQEVAKNREKDKQILQQSRLAQMGEMISMIAHQWRQPLGAISTVAAAVKIKLALRKFDLTIPEEREAFLHFLEESLGKIEKYVKFLTMTIDDFRNFFKPDKQKDETTLTPLIDKTLMIIAKALEVNGITLLREDHSSVPLLLYSNEVTQVILNLLKNAEDVLKERAIKERMIWVRTFDKEGWSYIEVEDNAGGIDETILEKIFEPYFSTKVEKNGTGLGLYMCKTIVEDHCDGRLSVQNSDRGALFRIAFQGVKGC